MQLPAPTASAAEVAADCLAAQIADCETQWSLGTFGAIAEFMRDPGEPVEMHRYRAITARGGIALIPQEEMRLFAFETTTREDWSPRVAVCLPQAASAMNARTVLTELGPDGNALRPQDRAGILFDIGIGAWQVDVCVRISDPTLAAELRAHCGRVTFAPGSPAASLILTHSPHRVFIGRVGRIEIYQPIPPAHGKSPDGPHTHVLLDLLRHRRTHAATEPIPSGLVPCAYFYPAHPVKDARGFRRPFDPRRQAAMDALLRRFGDPQLVALKAEVGAAIAQGRPPIEVPAAGRFTRIAVRVALRQLRAATSDLPSLDDWLAAYERMPADDQDGERHIHHR